MAHTSKIEWTEATWNPWHGCHKVSPGCKNCYMFRDKKHYGQDPNVVVRSKTKFYDPLKWKEPRTIFTCSWSDFFIEEADPWRDEAFAIMALTPQHTYQVLTKRPDRMLEYLGPGRQNKVVPAACDILRKTKGEAAYIQWLSEYDGEWPPQNVWLGVSVEDQKTADERIPILLQTPAALRWLSIEPLLGPVNLSRWLVPWNRAVDHSGAFPSHILTPRHDGIFPIDCECGWSNEDDDQVNWVVVGGESGQDARPMAPEWARSLRDQCQAAGVPFFFKQWGEWAPTGIEGDGEDSVLIGKKKAGRLLDGREWNEMPEVNDADL